MSHSSPEAYATKEQTFHLYENLSAWVLGHCALEWENPDHNMGTYGDSGIPLTSGAPPVRSFEVSPRAIQTYAPAVMQEFQLDPEAALSLYQIPEAYVVETNDNSAIAALEKSVFEHTAPQLNLACNLAATPQGQPVDHLILMGTADAYCGVMRQRRILLDAGVSMPEEPRFSKYGTKIITQAEMAALGELTDMLYLYGPDATRDTSA